MDENDTSDQIYDLYDDWFMAGAFKYARYCRLADGPDEVHMMALGKQLIRSFAW